MTQLQRNAQFIAFTNYHLKILFFNVCKFRAQFCLRCHGGSLKSVRKDRLEIRTFGHYHGVISKSG